MMMMQQGSSLSALLSTLIPVLAQAAAFVLIFLLVRATYKRVYQPRTYLPTLYEEEKSKELPTGRFNWFGTFWNTGDEFVLNRQSLDGYLYLRFLKMMAIICAVGVPITWPILMSVTATADGGQKELDLLSFSNIGKDQKNRYYAHVFVGWVFFSFVMYVITRETIYYINLRHIYLCSPFNAAKISARTVLFSDVPAEYLSSEKLQALFGSSMRRCWLATDCQDLEEDVENRDKAAMKLENSEIKLSSLATKRKLKWEKKRAKGKKGEPSWDATDEEAAVMQSRWQKKKDRPTHKLGKIPFIGKKVDTIEWSRSELKTLTPKIEEQRLSHQKADTKLLPSVFVEFNTQQAAQAAYRRMTPKKSPRMLPRAIGVAPKDIVWKNLKLTKGGRMGRKFLTHSFLVWLILFWAIPVAVVGAISNINYLTNKVHFLSFINHIPKVILGVVTGLLPSVLLSVLMSLVPVICRWMAKLGGEISLPAIELSCQTWYMAFQVVDVFVITTFASGASSVVTQIINQPSTATTLLAENLPKASNFFISYIIVQGLGISAGYILNIGSLVVLTIVAKFLDKTPRKMFKRYITLAGLGWGTLYPQFGNLGIIALAYSIIAPLILGFAAIAFFLVYLAVRYNSLFILTNNVDTKGAAYSRALQQLMTGVYLSEVCLIGLFAINTAPGPIVLMVFFLVLTAIYHATMRHALRPLTMYLPDSLEGDDQANMFSTHDHGSYDFDKAGVPPSEAVPTHKAGMMGKLEGLFAKIFDPRKFSSHQHVRSLVPDYHLPQYSPEDEELAYYHPAISAPHPKVWLVRDEMGISKKETAESSEVISTSDDYATFDDKGKVIWEEERLYDVPVYEKRVDY